MYVEEDFSKVSALKQCTVDVGKYDFIGYGYDGCLQDPNYESWLTRHSLTNNSNKGETDDFEYVKVSDLQLLKNDDDLVGKRKRHSDVCRESLVNMIVDRCDDPKVVITNMGSGVSTTHNHVLANELLLKQVPLYFERYLKLQENRFIHFEHKVDKERMVVPLESRFSESYRSKVEKRMQWLACNYNQSMCVMLTLTFDPNLYKCDKLRMWTIVKPEVDRFLQALRMDFKRRGLRLPQYLCSIESMKGRSVNNFVGKGLPHVHIVFFNCARLMDYRQLRRYWKNGYLWINRDANRRKIRKPVDYITKYVTKTFCSSNEGNVLTQSLTWFFGLRSYTCSRKLGLLPLFKPGSGEWLAKYLLKFSGGCTLSYMLDVFRKCDDDSIMFDYSWNQPRLRSVCI